MLCAPIVFPPERAIDGQIVAYPGVDVEFAQDAFERTIDFWKIAIEHELDRRTGISGIEVLRLDPRDGVLAKVDAGGESLEYAEADHALDVDACHVVRNEVEHFHDLLQQPWKLQQRRPIEHALAAHTIPTNRRKAVLSSSATSHASSAKLNQCYKKYIRNIRSSPTGERRIQF